MKRTVEIIFTVIGIIMFGILLVGSTAFLNAQGDSELEEAIRTVIDQQETGEIPETVNVAQIIDFINGASLYLLIVTGVCAALGILAILFLVGNKKPKAAGIILIVTAVIGTLATVFMGIFGGIAYLVAGIVSLARKPKVTS
ncbi:DUF4064 domain-containing protein [Virgibacillus byunsanensis]|uniref:DUF4064 domain-containing protein n=1 Tax=Virgibacillus byunsanensis TaxID=570945 RepID=A0ABW3LLM1_9BACI